MITQHSTKPVVMFSQDGDKEVVKTATKAGGVYVVGIISSERLMPVIEAAISRFEETKQLRQTLKQANEMLEEQKVVERAKDILMRQRNLNEEEAYRMLRSMAMKKNMQLADISSQLIDVAKVLTI
jgi:response regulator NasT